MTDFTNLICKKNRKHTDDIEFLIFKVLMDIHECHEKLKCGIFEGDAECISLRQYYKNLSGPHEAVTNKMDINFFNCKDIPYVYSMEFDETFPLIAYPYKLYMKNKNNATPVGHERKIFDAIDKMHPSSVKDFLMSCRILSKLSEKTRKQIDIIDFL